MVDIRAHAEVRIWGQTVGAVVELENGRLIFEYAEAFRRQGIELSPIHLPISLEGPVSFDELRTSVAFSGLPGLLADSLPDAFGNKVIRSWFAARGRSEDALSPVQRLLYVGERAMGALSFHPAADIPLRAAEELSLELSDLMRDARRIIEGEPAVAIPEIYRIGSSAGGMRPKAVVLYDATSKTIRSAYASPGERDLPCILKFDGVGDGHDDHDLGKPMPFNRIEAAYSKMAQAAGLEACEIEVLEIDGYAHLLIKRFDLDGEKRIHQHSLGGLIHVDYNLPGASSYEEYLRTVLRLGMAGGKLEEAYRRTVFNVLAVNQDDHVKNLSFHLRQEGEWDLSPAYDLTFAKGKGFTRHHQMRLADKTANLKLTDLLDLAKTFGIKRPQRILNEVEAATTRFREFAEVYTVPESALATVETEIALRRQELRGS